FYDGSGISKEVLEAQSWVDAIINDTEPVVKPEQALVVTEILEAIYESSKTNAPVFF
ncbi:MAG: Gfo/Idh/MocA family oxidoreductase, partial [Enterococcus aquimarinus]